MSTDGPRTLVLVEISTKELRFCLYPHTRPWVTKIFVEELEQLQKLFEKYKVVPTAYEINLNPNWELIVHTQELSEEVIETLWENEGPGDYK